MTLKIFLTGRVAVELDGKTVIDERQFRGKQGRHIFSYLVCRRAQPSSREELANLLWPENPTASWEVALSAVISRFSGVLSSKEMKANGVRLDRGFGQYQLNLPSDVWIDMEAGISAVDRAEGALRNGNPNGVLGPATIAASIARRPFLPGVQGYWADIQRSKMERQLIRSLDCLSKMWLLSSEPGLAIETASEAISLDPYRDSSYQILMEAYAGSGNRAEAVKVYHDLRQRLADELSTEPSAETEALYLRLIS